jgi:HEPN domain-containing protein
MPLTPADAYRMAQEYFDRWLPSVESFIRGMRYALADGDLNKAAFDLHQATERLYICFLLVRTLYFPRSHNIKFLRSLSEAKDPRLVEAWPRDTKLDRSRFERLKRAYVEARYSASYEISGADLEALTASVARLREIVIAICTERLDELKRAAD